MVLPLSLLALTAGAHGAGRVSASFPIGGMGSYDYIRFDPEGHRLFVTHQTRVEVLDADSGRKLGEIAGLKGVHGVALAPGLGRGFITNGLNGEVTVFDLHSLEIVGSIATGGQKPDGVEYDPASGLLVVSNGHSHNESLIDARTGRVLHLVPLSGNPEEIAFDGAGRVLVNLESASSVAKIDLSSGSVLSVWPISPGDGPTGLALDRQHHRAFVTCGGNDKMIVIDSRSGRVIASLPIGEDSDGAAFDPRRHLAFSSNRGGTLTVVKELSPEKFEVAEDIPTEFGAKTLTEDPETGRVFLPVAKLIPGRDEDHPGPAVPGTFKVLVVTP